MEARQDVQIQEQETKSWPTVAIIVLNWNGWRDTIECLESLRRITYPDYQIIVVDNGSTDDSVERIKAWTEGRQEPVTPEPSHFLYCLSQPPSPKPIPYVCWTQEEAESGDNSHIHTSLPHPLVFIRINTNLGFSAGNNVGIRYAVKKKFSYLLVLNNDTVVMPDFLDKLISFAWENPDSKLIGPRILDYSNGSNWQFPIKNPLAFSTVLIALTPLSRLLRYSSLYKNCFYREDLPQQVYAVLGSCMLFEKETFSMIGLFDEKTFLYWEEIIVAEKLRKCQLKTYIQPASIIYHKVGKSTKKLKALSYIANIEAEKYFFTNYFFLNSNQRLIMKVIRSLFYFVRMLTNIDYARNFKKFAKAIRNY
ncbi:MAG: N-acetylglucosaminyl-diphospho-decaprenol L-rhamnosyltransferase [Syntrophomonadaceae bacterium]|nr:N-acetylglucosaminyl-diphospho-decaprenol L-rhamnosyltransferase [Bacillota bacterium]